MANTGYTSPFPTSHDTIGQSTLVTPLFMPSSPPQHSTSPTPESPLPPDSPVFSEHSSLDERNDQGPPSDNERPPEKEVNHMSRSSTPSSPTGADLDARLAEYTLDFSQFPSGQFSDGRDADPLPDWKNDLEERLSDVGGPEDFTANMEKYLIGEGMSSARKLGATEEGAEPGSASQHHSVRSRQPAVEEEAESGDYSEFGPPVDMSTPSHVLHRTSALAKDSTHLENIEEDPADNDDDEDDGQVIASPSNRKMSLTADIDKNGAKEREDDLHARIERLEKEVQSRDEQLERNHNRVLEAASAGEQIRHLQGELERRNAHIDGLQAQEKDVAILREQNMALKKQNDEREQLLRQSSANSPDLNKLQQQIWDMQQQLQNRDSQHSLDNERLETIAHLRQQLKLTQEQLEKRDSSLEETLSKLREITRSKETQLHEKNAEIDRLKAETDDQALENERLEMELDRVNADYQALEDRLTTLEMRNQPLEEKNQSLEADLSRVQSQVEAQESALKAVAADLPIGGRSTYSEILDLIKDLGHPGGASNPESPLKDTFLENQDMQLLGQEINKLQQELQETSASQKAADAEVARLREQAAESQTLIQSVEAENSRLTSRVEELTTSLNKTQHELTRTREEHAESLETVAQLQEEKLGQPPSPPPSPPRARGAGNSEPAPTDAAPTEASHQAQIRSLQTAHSTAISTLRASHAESMRKIRNLLTAAEQREADLRTELTSLRISASSQETQLRRTFKSEIKRLESVVAAKDETAAEVDQRIALSVDKREREWQRRVDLLLKERDRMAKALMMSWGEKEMGRGPGVLADKENRRRDGDRVDAKQGQAYKYKYAQKHKPRSGEKGAV
ncbi:uncharacterized protein N7459_008259 [Penicillium hispanicum]|uniref:uncharacterized protein n=1 Tax=Penicillium hispanicum TaxID=1080232 RepID=UPI00254172C6|nr:uncharacterized protein N7459_008259 [Penicillium hispanicum]KAJ5573832.1 hypothetical protein N7459_008259 [Penicillium hispanicum]